MTWRRAVTPLGWVVLALALLLAGALAGCLLAWWWNPPASVENPHHRVPPRVRPARGLVVLYPPAAWR